MRTCKKYAYYTFLETILEILMLNFKVCRLLFPLMSLPLDSSLSAFTSDGAWTEYSIFFPTCFFSVTRWKSVPSKGHENLSFVSTCHTCPAASQKHTKPRNFKWRNEMRKNDAAKDKVFLHNTSFLQQGCYFKDYRVFLLAADLKINFAITRLVEVFKIISTLPKCW